MDFRGGFFCFENFVIWVIIFTSFAYLSIFMNFYGSFDKCYHILTI